MRHTKEDMVGCTTGRSAED